MKKIYTKSITVSVIFLMFFCANNTYAQAPSIQWQRSLGGSDMDIANSIKQTPEGGYIIAGGTRSIDGDVSGKHAGEDFWIVKLDKYGLLIWQKCLGGNGDEEANSIQLTRDGGYVVQGWTTSNDGDVNGNHGNKDYWVVKLDISGNTVWQKCLGGSNEDVGYEVQETLDGGLILSGNTKSADGDVTGIHGSGVRDIWLVKLNGTGNIEWQKCFGGYDEEYFNANSIQQTIDSGFIFNGYTWSVSGDVTSNHGADDYWTVKLNRYGSIEWQKSLGGSSTDGGYAVQQTTDGGYIDAGAAYSNDGNVSGGHGYSDCWIAKLNRLGSIEWQKPYGGSNDERPYSIKQTLEGGFVFAGFSTSEDGDVTGYHKAPYTNDYWVVKLDVSGNLVWQKCLGGFSNDESRSIQQTSDTGYIVAGFANSANGDVTGHHGSAYVSDCWIVKLGRPNAIPVIAGVTDITSSNAVLHWYPFLTASSYLVRRYVAGTTDYKYNLPVADTLKTIINLMPSTQYYVQVKAIFGINDSSDWSFPYSFITAGGCEPPQNLQVTRTADTLAKLAWTMPASPVKWFHIRYKPSRISAWIEKKINGNTNDILLHGLLPGTTYKWEVRSLCIADWSQWIDGPDFTTAPGLLIALTETNNVVDKEVHKLSLVIIPNPNRGNFTLQMQLPENVVSTNLALYNSLGIKVWQQDAGMLHGSVIKSIALENKLPAGTYILMIERSDVTQTKKVMITK